MKAPPAFVSALVLLLLPACVAPAASEPVSRMVTLQHAPAEEVALQLGPRLPPGVALDVLVVPGVNGILLRGSPQDCDALEAEIRRLDRSAGD